MGSNQRRDVGARARALMRLHAHHGVRGRPTPRDRRGTHTLDEPVPERESVRRAAQHGRENWARHARRNSITLRSARAPRAARATGRSVGQASGLSGSASSAPLRVGEVPREVARDARNINADQSRTTMRHLRSTRRKGVERASISRRQARAGQPTRGAVHLAYPHPHPARGSAERVRQDVRQKRASTIETSDVLAGRGTLRRITALASHSGRGSGNAGAEQPLKRLRLASPRRPHARSARSHCWRVRRT